MPATPPPDYSDQNNENITFTTITDAQYALSFSGSLVAVTAALTFNAQRAGRLVFDLALLGCLDAHGNRANPTVRLGAAGTAGTLEDTTTPGNPAEHYAATSFVTNGPVQDTAIIRYWLDATRLQSYEPDAPPVPVGRWDCLLAFSDHGDQEGRPGSDTDFQGRGFLERYLPCNPEFNQHPMRFDITLDVQSDPAKEHKIYVSGQPPVTTSTGTTQTCTIHFGAEFSASCPFVFITPGSYPEATLQFARPTGGPGTLHVVSRLSKDAAQKGKAVAEAVLEKLQRPEVLGSFPHTHFTLFVTDWDAMEYRGACSATLNRRSSGLENSSDTLLHELVHAWFGRGVLPANGNAGWFDEAVAQWIARAAPVVETRPDTKTSVASWPAYRRLTDGDSYVLGPMLMGHIAYLMGGSRHLLAALRSFYSTDAGKALDEITIWNRMAGWSPGVPALRNLLIEPLPPVQQYPAGNASTALCQVIDSLLSSQAEQRVFFLNPESKLQALQPSERALLATMNRRRIAAYVRNADPGLADRILDYQFASAWPHVGTDDDMTVLNVGDPERVDPEIGSGGFDVFDLLAFAGGAGNGGWTDPRPHGRGIRRNPFIPANRPTPVVVIGEGFLEGAEIVAWDAASGFGVGNPVDTFSTTMKKGHFRRRRLRAWIDLQAGEYLLSVRNPGLADVSEEILAGQILRVF